MTTNIPFKTGKIRFADEGSGNAVVLLHGYLESLEIWNGFYQRLTPHYRVIRIDVPGHGQSDVVADVHGMDLMAEAVNAVLQHLDVRRCVLTGHSMGGYVSLAYLAHYPERLAGLCLFHSSPFADTEEKKAYRTKEIRLVSEGKLSLICNTSIPNGFATDNLQAFSAQVEYAKHVARQMSPAGVTAILKGMRERPDRQELLKNNTVPTLFLLGKKDNYIAFERFAPVAAAFPHTTVAALEHSGHSGYLEEPEKSAELLLAFLDRCHVQT
ncbi:MAG: alpha/beta fold hydrolase [Bacteroidales bacterium]|jgi:pimeloyl-ACP methyl ester carboxylesterase|nr:alpha/beta fold hydrolase [Bacteroidales bacterium]